MPAAWPDAARCVLMKPDSEPPRLDLVERAHLKEPGDSSSVMYRYAPAPGLAGLVRRFWIPVWSVPPGQEAPQRVLQYPVCLLVVASDYARFYGVVTGLSTTTLTGDGWAVGVMCTPAAGALLAGAPVARYTDRHVDVGEVLGGAGDVLVDRVRTAMAGDPHAETAHRAATTAFDAALRPFLPVDPEGELVDRVVAFVEEDSEVTRVGQVCDAFGLSERALQRLVHRRLGLTPKWLIQRRGLQEASERLRTRSTTLAEVASLLGYAHQPHFIRDFSRGTGVAPGEFAAPPHPGRRVARAGARSPAPAAPVCRCTSAAAGCTTGQQPPPPPSSSCAPATAPSSWAGPSTCARPGTRPRDRPRSSSTATCAGPASTCWRPPADHRWRRRAPWSSGRPTTSRDGRELNTSAAASSASAGGGCTWTAWRCPEGGRSAARAVMGDAGRPAG